MSNRCRLIVLLVSVLCSQGLYAQIRKMRIEEMFGIAEQASTSRKVHQSGIAAASEGVKAAKAQRLPDIKASASVSYWGNGTLWNRKFREKQSIAMPHFGNNFALEAQQVIYAGGAISSGIRLAELGEAMAVLEGKKNQQEIRFLLAGHYLNLLKLDNQQQVIQKNLELTERVLGEMALRHQQGTVLKTDITRYELQREQLRLRGAQVKDQRDILNYQLVKTLQLPETTVIMPDTAVANATFPTGTEADWQQWAAAHHCGLQQAHTAVLQQEQQLKMERSARLPQVALFAMDQLNGPITIEVPVLNKNFNCWQVGVGVQFNLSSWYKKSNKIRQARIKVQQAQQQQSWAQEQVNQAVQAGYTQMRTAFTDWHTQENSVKLAQEHYAVTFSRYQQAMALLTDLLDASNMKLQAELGLANARIQLLYHYYQMKYLTHTL